VLCPSLHQIISLGKEGVVVLDIQLVWEVYTWTLDCSQVFVEASDVILVSQFLQFSCLVLPPFVL